ncbi:hypothetical protein Pelo_10285 [Pelomyxa schiedti]|nr:hypothetical protein Pelo_10285 [Pelomyxa schiedti]
MSRNKKQELVDMINRALEEERAAVIEYTGCFAMLQGAASAPIACVLKCCAEEEAHHAKILTKMICCGLESVPTMGTRAPRTPSSPDQILPYLMSKEKEEIDMYRNIRNKVCEYKDELPTSYECMDDKLRHIIIEEEKHYVVLKKLQ